MMSLFFAKERQAHCLRRHDVARWPDSFWARQVEANLDYLDPEIPPDRATIEGVDLVTEGVITINRVLDLRRETIWPTTSSYADWSYKRDGASLIARMLFEEATDINFFVGRAVNPAHQNPDLPINFSIKMRLVDGLSECAAENGQAHQGQLFLSPPAAAASVRPRGTRGL